MSSGGEGAGGSSTGGVSVSDDTVTRSESTYTFQHYPIETGSSGVWSGSMSAGQQAESTTFDTVVLENGFLKVTLLPEYGGRILSIVHKPTDRELLYQNPVGTPYLMYEDIFYYDYLVILGGIFPSFPEPEHGRYWNLPYEFEVLSESEGEITVRMSRLDDLDLVSGVPQSYDVGRTDVLVQLDVTLRAGSTSLQLHTTLSNTQNAPVAGFEYWTVTTLAPGSVPGQTSIPTNTRIIADMERVHLLESSWSWFGDAEQRIDGEIFEWNNLALFENWVDQGTGFANPSYQSNYSGLINSDANMGILRVTDSDETPGLKLWTFGRDSVDVDLAMSEEWLRPTIEMWHGVTPEFWERGTMAENEVRAWSEHYFPTLGLPEITAASEHGAVFLTQESGAQVTTLTARASLTLPGQTVTAVLRLAGTVVAEEQVMVSPTDTTVVAATVPSGEAIPGAVFQAEFVQGQSTLLVGELLLQ